MEKNPPANAGEARDAGSIFGSGRSPEVEDGNPFQCSCLESSMDRGIWWAIIHGVAESQTQMSVHARTCTRMQKHTHTQCKLFCVFCMGRRVGVGWERKHDSS